MKVIVNELAIEYKDSGEGPFILMLHGWGNTLHYFDELCAELPGFRVVRLDLPGFGDSEGPHEPWGVEEYARFAASFCKKVQCAPMCIVGHSLGGRIVTKGVSRGIFQPERIVLIASAGVAARNTLRNRVYALIAKLGKYLLWPLPKVFYERARRMLYAYTGSDYLTVRNMSQTFLRVISEDLSSAAATLAIPTLLVWGEDDTITPLSEGKRLHKLIAKSQLCVIKNAGHFVHREKPQEVARLIREFLI